ncbi:hypothetical protein BDR05DRAFT_957675 [Suillus weaverae]|nr:hypothetical protein BDR05DRAFT_957675 [Suillus weaverae]
MIIFKICGKLAGIEGDFVDKLHRYRAYWSPLIKRPPDQVPLLQKNPKTLIRLIGFLGVDYVLFASSAADDHDGVAYL